MMVFTLNDGGCPGDHPMGATSLFRDPFVDVPLNVHDLARTFPDDPGGPKLPHGRGGRDLAPPQEPPGGMVRDEDEYRQAFGKPFADRP